MLISEFARQTGLPLDTVRYYVRRGLFRPELGGKGGRNPYQIFGAADVRAAGFVRLGQALGLSLGQIAMLLDEERSGRIDEARSLAILRDQRARLLDKAAELDRLVRYLDAKIAWIEAGSQGDPPAPDAPGARPPPLTAPASPRRGPRPGGRARPERSGRW